MANMQAEALGIALEALEVAQDNLRPHGDNCFLHDEGEYSRCFCGKDSLSNYLQDAVEKLDTAIKQALAAPVQEPVAFEAFNEWMHENLPVGTVIGHSGWWAGKIYDRFIKNTTPPATQRQWVSLTDEELHKLWRESPFRGSGGQMDWFTEGARVAEAKLKEKNT